jgi:UDP-2-acetamido-3-amino-2,3-dideoxy-glucuronate N-acetyltransferase
MMSSSFIHSTAVVEEGSEVGEETRVWHHAHIRSGAKIGKHCTIGKNVYVDQDVLIGNGCKVQNNVSIYKGVTLEDEVFVGPSAVFTNDLLPRAGSTEWNLTETLVQRGASIGANATIVAGVVIRSWAMVGAGAVVTRDVEPHSLVLGVPARHSGWVCFCGEIRARGSEAIPPDPCSKCGRKIEQ